jgi:hypothetical protein
MKLRTKPLPYVALLVLLVAGTVVLMSSTGQEPLIADQLKFIPKDIDMENTAALNAEIKLTDAENNTVVEDIDASTVLLEGSVAPTSTWIEYRVNGKPKLFAAMFDGNAVKGLLWYMIGHMGISMPKPWNPLIIHLTITGQLDDGTPWEGTATVLVSNWASGGAPPPPPPP